MADLSHPRIPVSERDVLRIERISDIGVVVVDVADILPLSTPESGFRKLWSIHTNNIRSMWSGEQTPEEAAKNMVTQLKEAIELMNSGK